MAQTDAQVSPLATQEAPARSRRARKKAGTRRDIYRAAMRLFRERSFDDVTIEAICAEADVARGTFFLHFPTKAALLYEFNSEVAEDFRARLEEPRGSAVSELEILVDMVGERLRADSEVTSAMLREYFSMPQPSITEAKAKNRDLQDLLESIIVRGQERGELRASLAPSLAVAAFLSISNAILTGALPPDTRPEEARRQFFEIVLHGISTDPS